MFNFIAPINDRSYGLVATNLIHNLDKIGVSPGLFLIGGGGSCSDRYKNAVLKSVKNAEFYNPESPCVRLWHQFDMAQFVGKGPRIGFPIFELNKFNEVEKHNLQWLDGIIVCSKWAKGIIETEVPKFKGKIAVVPLSVDMDIFRPRIKDGEGPYKIFTAGKCEIRKGHDVLVDILNKAFTEKDNVEIHIGFENPFYTADEMSEWKRYYLESALGRAGRIKFLPWFQSQEELAAAMAAMDCAIFPSRAEGWNLELAECIAMGIPVITTNYSAHTEFCNKENSYLVDIDELELAYDGKWFFNQGEWAKIGSKQISGFVDYLKHCYQNRITQNNGKLEKTWLDSSKIFSDFLRTI